MVETNVPVQIVRYKNRKLYSRTHSAYVNLSDIRDIIREGKEVQVTDNESFADITSHTLSQVLTATTNVPVSRLRELITGTV